MQRRAFIINGGKAVGAISLGLLSGYSCQTREVVFFQDGLTPEGIAMINELGEIIIPTTDTPGAKTAGVGEFIAVIVRDCYSDKDKKEFAESIAEVNKKCDDLFGCDFLKCNQEERLQLVSEMYEDFPGFKVLKDPIVSAYLSSEVGVTKFFEYHPVPGRYDGCTSVRPW